MKKYFSLMAIAAAVMLGFASCSDDEGSTNPTTPGGSTMADNVAGIYDSQIAVSINGNDLQPSNYAVEITKSSDTEIKFTLRDFSITDPSGMTLDLGTIELDGVKIAKVNSAYSFATVDTLSLAIFGGEPLPVPIDFSGSFTDTTIDANIDINFGETMVIVVDINGTKRGISEGGDQPSEPELTMAQEIAGDYASNIAVTINSSEPIVSENTVYITAVSAEVVNLALNNFVITDPTSGAEIAPGDIVLENVPLMRDSLGISFMASDTLMLAVVPGVDPLPVPVVANGNVNGDVLDAHFDIDFMNGAMAIAVEIDGQKN